MKTTDKQVIELFEKCGKNASYSRTEINILRRLGLIPSKPKYNEPKYNEK